MQEISLRPRWPWLAPLTMAISGAAEAIAIYLTIAHYTTPALLACPGTSLINCAKVTTSPASMLFGIPVALVGTVYFLVMLPLCLPAAWRSHNTALRITRQAMATAGMLFVLYLVGTEFLVLGSICLWCSAVHVLSFALFLLITAATASGATG